MCFERIKRSVTFPLPSNLEAQRLLLRCDFKIDVILFQEKVIFATFRTINLDLKKK